LAIDYLLHKPPETSNKHGLPFNENGVIYAVVLALLARCSQCQRAGGLLGAAPGGSCPPRPLCNDPLPPVEVGAQTVPDCVHLPVCVESKYMYRMRLID
jgi:hypothetical protein